MTVELNFQKFKKSVSLSERVAGKHTTLPVLSCFLLDIKKTSVIIKATNLDLGIETNISAKSDKEGVYALPAGVVSSFISQIPDHEGLIQLEDVSGNIRIKSFKSKGMIKSLPLEDFPSIPNVRDGMKTEINPSLISKGMQSVWYSASVSGVKPELSSVYMYNKDNSMFFAATDSFRLAEKKLNTPSFTKMPDILVPAKNIPDMTRILDSMESPVSIEANKNIVSFKSKDIYLVSRIIDGVFPDYKQIIPKTHSTEAIVLKQDLVNALKISNIFSDKFNHIKFIFDPKSKSFSVYTSNSDIGENITNIDAAISGESIEINFNYKYIIDCFQSIDSDSVSLQLNGANRPMIIRPVSGDSTFMYLVMPMNR